MHLVSPETFFGNTDVNEKALAVSRKCCGYKHQHNCKYNVFRYSLLKRCIGFENQILLYKEVYGLGCCSCNQKA